MSPSLTNVENASIKESVVASRKLAAAEQRKARKAARDPRNRLFSDSSDEVPKGILKNARIPTKRSVSECVDDLSQIMADLDLNIHDLPKATTKFCPHHHHHHQSQFFREEDEDEEEEEEDDDEDEDEEEGDENNTENNENNNGDDEDDINERNLKKCDCNIRYSDSDNNGKPKKSVRFDERVYETVFFASRLYDRRSFAKYHFSSRHHPPSNQQNGKSKKKQRRHSSGDSSDEHSSTSSVSSSKSENLYSSCKLSKSQRAKQSKKDKKKRLNKKDDTTETSSDDQGYCSSMHSFSD